MHTVKRVFIVEGIPHDNVFCLCARSDPIDVCAV